MIERWLCSAGQYLPFLVVHLRSFDTTPHAQKDRWTIAAMAARLHLQTVQL